LNIVGERTRFCCVANALPYETLRLVADLVASPPMEQPYMLLKERLLLAHAMTATQRAEKLFSLPSLGGRRPSDLLAAMYEFCPPGEETTELFKALFLTRLLKQHQDSKQAATAPPTAQASGGGGSGNGAKKSVTLTICWKHAKFGGKAFSCADPAACQWPEN
jgi:hypothetical protein